MKYQKRTNYRSFAILFMMAFLLFFSDFLHPKENMKRIPAEYSSEETIICGGYEKAEEEYTFENSAGELEMREILSEEFYITEEEPEILVSESFLRIDRKPKFKRQTARSKIPDPERMFDFLY